MKVKKALITAAGFGTRFLPITKTIQKEMLPILNRPLIDYVVEDLVKAGVEEIIFVISEHNIQLIHYYRENLRLRDYLKAKNKLDLYQEVSNIHQQAKFTFVRQPDEGAYGTAVPVLLAEEQLKDEEAFFVFMGDDFLASTEVKISESQQMKKLFESSQAAALATCIEKPNELLHLYGVVKTKEINGQTCLDYIVEKPTASEAPSNLVNISKYIFTPQVFEIIKKQSLDEKNGELQITDTITTVAKAGPVIIYTPQGHYFDGGNVAEWLKANLTFALADPKLKPLVLELVKSIHSD